MEIKKEFKGYVGLYLVCAELSKRNLIALPTLRNTKGYDIVVLNPVTNKSIGIQVKCSDKKEFPIFSSHWRDYEKKINEKILSPFILVDISNIDAPEYYILTEKEMKNLMKRKIEEYISSYQKRHKITLNEEREKRKPDLWVLKLSDVKDYKNKWKSIIDLLQ